MAWTSLNPKGIRLQTREVEFVQGRLHTYPRQSAENQTTGNPKKQPELEKHTNFQRATRRLKRWRPAIFLSPPRKAGSGMARWPPGVGDPRKQERRVHRRKQERRKNQREGPLLRSPTETAEAQSSWDLPGLSSQRTGSWAPPSAEHWHPGTN